MVHEHKHTHHLKKIENHKSEHTHEEVKEENHNKITKIDLKSNDLQKVKEHKQESHKKSVEDNFDKAISEINKAIDKIDVNQLQTHSQSLTLNELKLKTLVNAQHEDKLYRLAAKKVVESEKSEPESEDTTFFIHSAEDK